MTDEAAKRTLEYINNCDIFEDVKTCDFEKAVADGIIEYIDESFLDKYFELVLSRSINPETARNTDLSVIYTPLNGTGNKPVRKILSMMGIELPGNGDVWYFVFMTGYFGIHFAANYFLRSRVEVAYALAYDCLRPEEKKPEGVVLGNIFQM